MNYNLYSKDIEELTAHLNAGVSPFHTVQYSAELLKGRGFEELKLDAPGSPKPAWAILSTFLTPRLPLS